MIPLKDDTRPRRFPYLTAALVAANAAVFVLQQVLGNRGNYHLAGDLGLIPARLVHGSPGPSVVPVLLTPVTAMFLHGGPLHLGANMLYLWIFGRSVEDRLGRGRFFFFYFLCGLVAAGTQIASDPHSPEPMIGASGAVAGVLGAYLILFPGARVLTWLFFVWFLWLPAGLVLGLWFLVQLRYGLLSLGGYGSGGVAWFAHIGGFATGIALALVYGGRKRRPGWPPKRPSALDHYWS